jgi:bifunctional DNA-binding transcriptional regulator/antitoxin component of YhaV-PrlF toxin-antitoxin module
VPKRLRDELGLQPGQELELEVSDGRLHVEIAPIDIRFERRRHGPVAVAAENMPTLTADMVRQTLEHSRR